MTRPAFFVVALDHAGREAPAIYWDELPRGGIRRLIYAQRLDLSPNAEKLMSATLAELFEVYRRLKRMGKLRTGKSLRAVRRAGKAKMKNAAAPGIGELAAFNGSGGQPSTLPDNVVDRPGRHNICPFLSTNH